MKTEIINVNLNTFSGTIPTGFDLVEYEKGTDPLDGGPLNLKRWSVFGMVSLTEKVLVSQREALVSHCERKPRRPFVH